MPPFGERVTAYHTFLWGVGVVSLNNNLWSLQPQDFFQGLVWFVSALLLRLFGGSLYGKLQDFWWGERSVVGQGGNAYSSFLIFSSIWKGRFLLGHPWPRLCFSHSLPGPGDGMNQIAEMERRKWACRAQPLLLAFYSKEQIVSKVRVLPAS